MIKKILGYLLFFLTSFLFLELSFFIATKAKLINIMMPTYELDSPADFLPQRSFIYGYQHQANSSFEVKKNCLHNFYRFNSLGFRDEEPKKSSTKKRVLVLGDSFMEGIGIEENQRLSDLLETKTGIPHLNFAMGDKGPTQFYSIYKNIASDFDHDALLISFFPNNDFIDDDPNIGKDQNSIRPCWIGEYPNYSLRFVPDSAPAKKPFSTWKLFLKRYTYTYDALFYLKESIKAKILAKNYPKAGYFDFNEAQINRMLYSLKKIKELANGKKIILLSIPSDIELQTNQEANESIEKVLGAFCQKEGIEFYGLFPYFKKASNQSWKDFYLDCDSHWNANGHAYVAELLLTESIIYRSNN